MSQEESERGLVRGWVAAVGRAEVVAGLEGMYAEVAAAVVARGPVCWASGRCCNFAKTGHLLYATGLETAYTIARVGGSNASGGVLKQWGDWREHWRASRQWHGGPNEGGCPFQVLNLCGVHGIRPLGCRVYFCDRSATEWQRELYEGAMKSLRELHDRYGIEYRYGEWRGMLGRFVG